MQPLHAGFYADQCKVQHQSTGLCVAMSGWPGKLVLQPCWQAWNGGNMWRFCDGFQGRQDTIGGQWLGGFNGRR